MAGVLSAVLIAGLAGVYLWVVLNLPVVPRTLGWLRALLLRLPKGEKLVSCPWCLGFWASGGSYLLISVDMGFGWVTPVGVLASAAVTGLIGSWLDE